ncbi:Hvo_1808 family surface protein [Halomarina litorea]|uniref:Hvo_1808 family surface protein n=1 Tax=Halomarina litorea TaxID=2961595 RepID=UPI0020C595C0|nr:Hvo_1808 family surface protein [Halomarina sp. BCD28]
MRRPALVVVALVVLSVVTPAVALQSAAAPTAAAPAAPTDTDAPATQSSAPPDPERDVLGWENGYWYNESVAVNSGDGLNQTELDAVVARSMARVEEVRQLEFESTVPVDILSRAEFREQNREGYSNVSIENSLHQNVKYEVLFMVNETTDAVAVQEANQGASVGGYYSPAEKRIVVVSDNTTSPQLSEVTLAQELFHALQDQQYDLTSFNQSTREKHNAIDGIVEGDGNYVDYLYQQRCELNEGAEGYWGECLQDTPTNGTGGGQLANIGLYLLVYQPYSDGPPFVKQLHERGGWEAVNAVYENPPASTEQTIHPKKYGEDAPTPIRIEDRSNESWEPLDLPDSLDYAEFGEAGVFSMFMYPALETQGQTQIIPAASFFNRNGAGEINPLDPYNYTSQYSAGWDGDKLLPYVTNGSADTNETGYVWKLAWDSPDDAEEFYTGYRQLLDYRGAERVGEDTYVLPDSGGYGDAVHVMVEGNTTTIVNAPTVDSLSGVDDRIEVQEVPNGTNVTNGTNGTAGTSDAGEDTSDEDASTGDGPGFGVVAAVVALLVAALFARTRTRRD